MEIRVPRDKLAKLGLGAAMLLAGGIVLRKLTRAFLNTLQRRTYNPAHSYASALERFTRVQIEEATNLEVNPVCRSRLLTHGKPTDQVIILMHGMTNCPRQYHQLAQLLYKQGYNVLIPRIPHNGLANLDTDALKYLTAEELRDSCDTMVDIARGLGKHITYAGLSAGGVMAAWVAQNRADVDRVVIIAPSFTFSPRANLWLSRVCMYLMAWLPNLMTQRVLPIKEGPFYNYLGFATRGLGQMMRLGFAAYDAAGRRAPVAPAIVVVTNAADPAVNNRITDKLAERWRAFGEARVETYVFDAHYHLLHDIVDPLQKQQQIELVYPILLKLIAPEQQFALSRD